MIRRESVLDLSRRHNPHVVVQPVSMVAVPGMADLYFSYYIAEYRRILSQQGNWAPSLSAHKKKCSTACCLATPDMCYCRALPLAAVCCCHVCCLACSKTWVPCCVQRTAWVWLVCWRARATVRPSAPWSARHPQGPWNLWPSTAASKGRHLGA
jgi:hypothetical protein